MEDTKCVEHKNFEFSKAYPGSMPCIILNDAVKGSPKLIHIAKTNNALPSESSECKKEHKGKKIAVAKEDIGNLGSKDGKCFIYL